MTITTLVKYLFGSKEAILRIVQTRRSLSLGLLFVLSAGFAREYDGEDLLHEPWHLLIPLGASLVSSFVLYGLVARVAWLKGDRTSFWNGYTAFLSLFWMTAPLAWLYAIPVERFMSAAGSVSANLWLLGIVAAWRVVLITRVISVLYQVRWSAVFFVVMLFSDIVVWIVLALTPLPLVSIMGGIRLTQSEAILRDTACTLEVLATLSAPIWFFGTVAVVIRRYADPFSWQRIDLESSPSQRIGLSLWIVSGAALLIWIPVLPTTQPEQINRHVTETALRENRIGDALTLMSARERKDFPPHWDPPPRIGFGDKTPDIWEVFVLVGDDDVADWVRELFTDKILGQSRTPPYASPRVVDLSKIERSSLEAYLQLLRDAPEGQEIAAGHRHAIERIFRRARDPDHPRPIPEWRRDLLEEILALGDDAVRGSQEPVPAADPAAP